MYKESRELFKNPDVIKGEDIKIEYTGLRPGEKLFEEKLMAEEGLRTTPNHLIHIGNPIPFNVTHFLRQLENLMEVSYANDEVNIRLLVEDMVPTYQPQGKTAAPAESREYQMT